MGAALSLLCVGCQLLVAPAPVEVGQSPLEAAPTSPEAVTLDIYWVHLPADAGIDAASDSHADIWDHVQEDRLPVDLRRRLASNGLRAGVVGGATPDTLLRLLDPQRQGDLDVSGAARLQQTGVRRRTRQLRPGDQIELNASAILPEAPLLVCRSGAVSGRTYRRAQAVYVVSVERSADGRTTLRMAPQVRHGEQLLRFVSDDTGVVSRGSMRRPTRGFPELTIATTLDAGEMLLVAGLPGSGARLGGLFHGTPAGGVGGGRGVLVRVSGAPASRAFDPEA